MILKSQGKGTLPLLLACVNDGFYRIALSPKSAI